MISKVFRAIKYIFFFGIGILLLYLAFKDNNPKEMLHDFKEANYYWVGLAMFCGFLAFVSRGHRWLILLEPLDYHPRFTNSVYAVCVAYIANLAIPRIGELTRCTALHQVEKIPVNALFGTIILERVLDMLILLFLFVFVFFAKMEFFGKFFTQLYIDRIPSIHISTIQFVFLLAIFLFIMLLFYFFRSYFAHLHIYNKSKEFIKGIISGFISIFKLKNKMLFFFHTLFIWLMYFLITYFCFFSIEATSHLGIIDALFVMVVGGIGMTVPVQGGIGVYHLLVSSALMLYIDPMTGTNISQYQGLVYATIVHTSQTLLVLICGSASLLLLYFARKINTLQNKTN